MPSYSDDDEVDSVEHNNGESPEDFFHSELRRSYNPKCYKEFGGRSSSQDYKSCPIIDDRSNSASPTRRQPNPTGMHAFGGFLGQSFRNDERIVEWPPPEPRNTFIRPVITNFTAMFLPRPRPLHNPHVWFFGPTAGVQQLEFEEVPTDADVQSVPNLTQVQSSEIPRTRSELSTGTGNDADMEFSSESIFHRHSIGMQRAETSIVSGPPLSNTDGRDTQNTFDNTIYSYRNRSTDESDMEIFSGVYTMPVPEEIRNETYVQQRVVQPPPNQIVFIMMHPNNDGADLPVVLENNTGDLNWALQQLLESLTGESVEEM